MPCSSPRGADQNNYDLIERVSAGYLMNTIDLTNRIRLVVGVRFEATNVSTLSFDRSVTPLPMGLTFHGGGSYFDVLPSASIRFALTKNTGLRFVFGRGLSRPDPQDITEALNVSRNQNSDSVSLGNPHW